jgi:hypothetical protein
MFDTGSEGSLEDDIRLSQQCHQAIMERWEENLSIQCIDDITGPHWVDPKGRLVVPPNDDIHREILRDWHDHRGAGHPGRDEMFRKIQRHYF